MDRKMVTFKVIKMDRPEWKAVKHNREYAVTVEVNNKSYSIQPIGGEDNSIRYRVISGSEYLFIL